MKRKEKKQEWQRDEKKREEKRKKANPRNGWRIKSKRKLSAFYYITSHHLPDEAKWIDKTYEFKMFKPNNTNIPNTYYVSTILKCMIPKKHISNFRSNQWLCSSLNKKSMILHNVLELHLTLREHWRWTWGSAIITKLCGKKNNNEFMEMFCTCWNYAH